MIIIQNAAPIYVGTTNGELFLTSGTWHLPQASYVQLDGTNAVTGTNAWVYLPAMEDGAVVTVDGGGLVRAVDGPRILLAGGYGFGTVIATVGLIMFMRWVYRFFAGAAGVKTPGTD